MGFTVFATCLDEKSNGAAELKRFDGETGRLHVIKMDVTNQEDVDKALEYVKENLPVQGLWGIVNNAAQSCCTGFLEWTSNEAYEKVQTNTESIRNSIEFWLSRFGNIYKYGHRSCRSICLALSA